jgi:hypothetical protein
MCGKARKSVRSLFILLTAENETQLSAEGSFYVRMREILLMMEFLISQRFGLTSKVRVVCPQCRTLMTIKGAMPRLGQLPEVRMFQCKLCDNVETRIADMKQR